MNTPFWYVAQILEGILNLTWKLGLTNPKQKARYWWVAIVDYTLWLVYCIWAAKYQLAVLEAYCVLAGLAGYLHWSGKRSKWFEHALWGLAAGIIIVRWDGSSAVALMESSSSALFLVGVSLLRGTGPAGSLFMLVGHIILVPLMAAQELYITVLVQIASIGIMANSAYKKAHWRYQYWVLQSMIMFQR